MIDQNPYSYDDFRFNLYGMYPAVPRGYLNKPPTLLRIMQSMALTKGDEIPRIKNLPAYVRDMIFDFEYPLSTKVEIGLEKVSNPKMYLACFLAYLISSWCPK